MSLRLRNIQVDVAPTQHAAAQAWWAAALGGTARGAGGPYTHLDGVRSPVGVHVQRLDEGPGRYHLDLEADDMLAEVARLTTLGATVVGDAGPSEEAVVLHDPAGLPFCVTSTGQAQLLSSDFGDQVQLRVLMFDVPATAHAREVAFWAAALGGQPVPVPAPYEMYTEIKGVLGPGGTVYIAIQQTDGEEPARLHVDLHCTGISERDTELARLEAAGATRVGNHDHWTVLAAPGGQLVCVVPDQHD